MSIKSLFQIKYWSTYSWATRATPPKHLFLFAFAWVQSPPFLFVWSNLAWISLLCRMMKCVCDPLLAAMWLQVDAQMNSSSNAGTHFTIILFLNFDKQLKLIEARTNIFVRLCNTFGLNLSYLSIIRNQLFNVLTLKFFSWIQTSECRLSNQILLLSTFVIYLNMISLISAYQSVNTTRCHTVSLKQQLQVLCMHRKR